jgi:hypothetical protein
MLHIYYLREEGSEKVNKPNAGLSVQMYEEAKWQEELEIIFSFGKKRRL